MPYQNPKADRKVAAGVVKGGSKGGGHKTSSGTRTVPVKGKMVKSTLKNPKSGPYAGKGVRMPRRPEA